MGRVCHAFTVTVPTETARTPDPLLADAVELARSVALDAAGGGDVGEHLGVVAETAESVSHIFDCTRASYVGWTWSVTLARTPLASAAQDATVNEVVLLPGAEAIVAPQWIPYKERLKPGDMSPGDLLPVEDADVRLVPTYLVGDGEDARLSRDEVASHKREVADIGLGRVRTLSVEGIDLAAERWYEGDGGPEAPLAKSAPDQCWSCGFLVRISGRLAETFGVCANGNANDDGRVVALNHGCGAHSEVKLARKQQPVPLPDHVHDTLAEDLDTF